MSKKLKKDTRRLHRTIVNIEKKQEFLLKELQTQSLVISSEEYVERSQGARSIIARGPLLNSEAISESNLPVNLGTSKRKQEESDDDFQPMPIRKTNRKNQPSVSKKKNPCTTTVASETRTATETDSQTVDITNESIIELEKRANETIKRLLPSKDLEEIWKLVMDRMSEKNIKVQAIESRIIDLTNWSSVEWSRILKTEDKAKLFRTCHQKLLKNKIDENVIRLIDKTSLRNLDDLKQLKDKLSNVGSEDGNLSAEIISFFHKCCRREVNILSRPTRERDYILRIMSPILTDLLEEYDSGRFQTYWIEKESKAVQTRKRCKIHAEFVKFGNESTKLDVVVESRNYGIELVTAEVGITEKDNDDLKFREDHTALKIELKDMIDNFYDVLHFKKKDLTEIFVMGIQATEVATLIVPKTMSAMESLLGPFIKNLLGFRHTLLMLNTKITKMAIARQSTPSPPLSPLSTSNL